MRKKYIVRLTDAERDTLVRIDDARVKLKSLSQNSSVTENEQRVATGLEPVTPPV